MRRAQVVIIAVMLWGFFLTTPASATNNQGLEWGVEIGDEFYYVFEFNHSELSTYTPRTGIEIIYVRITGLPEIPDNITSYTQYGRWSERIFWENGTEIARSSTYFPMCFGIKPIGNWSLITILFLSNPEKLINTTTTWGYNGSEGWTGVEINYSYEISKLDGVPNHSFQERRFEEESEWYSRSHELTRINDSEISTTTNGSNYLVLLGSLAGTGGSIIIIIIYIIRRRS